MMIQLVNGVTGALRGRIRSRQIRHAGNSAVRKDGVAATLQNQERSDCTKRSTFVAIRDGLQKCSKSKASDYPRCICWLGAVASLLVL